MKSIATAIVARAGQTAIRALPQTGRPSARQFLRRFVSVASTCGASELTPLQLAARRGDINALLVARAVTHVGFRRPPVRERLLAPDVRPAPLPRPAAAPPALSDRHRLGGLGCMRGPFGLVESARRSMRASMSAGAPLSLAVRDLRIVGRGEIINDSQRVRALQRSGDADVSLHWAEGSGLDLAEMMRPGTPVITARWSGNMTFMGDDNRCLVDVRMVRVADGEPLGASAVDRVRADADTATIAARARQNTRLQRSPATAASPLGGRLRQSLTGLSARPFTLWSSRPDRGR